MVVFIFEKVPASLRGELSRWLIEPRTGVFVGRVSAVVRDKLWESASRRSRGGAGMLVHSSSREQGFDVRSFGDTRRTLTVLDGLNLVHIPKPPERERDTGSEDVDAELPVGVETPEGGGVVLDEVTGRLFD